MLISLELAVCAVAIVLLLLELAIAPEHKRALGYAAALALGFILLFSYTLPDTTRLAFGGSYILDPLALFFKRFFLVAAIAILVLAADRAVSIQTGISEFYALVLFALSGMMFAASANDFALLFVSLELITVCFYILNSFQRDQVFSLEAGVKYLILGAMSSACLIYGIALVYGATGSVRFAVVAEFTARGALPGYAALGLLLIVAGLGFKIAAFPFQLWAPDVYQGSPVAATAFLAVGSKAAGFALLLRLLSVLTPQPAMHWAKLWMLIGALTILYGNLCAIPQPNLKRLLGYSSIANAGYLLLGVAALNHDGAAAVLYYLAGYLFSVVAAFTVVAIISSKTGGPEIAQLAGLHRRSPLLAASLTAAMVSLAGIPPLAGFFGKFLLLKSVLEEGIHSHGYYLLAAVAVIGVVISLYYYFGVVRAIYWSKDPPDLSPFRISAPLRGLLYFCLAGMLCLGVFPAPVLQVADQAANSLRMKTASRPPAVHRAGRAVRSAAGTTAKPPPEVKKPGK